MSNWSIRGTGATIGFNGVVPFVSGYIENTEIEFLTNHGNISDLDNISIIWEIHPSNYLLENSEIENFKRIIQSVKEQPDRVHYRITYHRGEGEPSIGFFIIIPHSFFKTQFSVWQDFVLGNKEVQYEIKLHDDGFLEAPSISKIEEFRKENPYYDNVPTLSEWKSDDYFSNKPLIGKDFNLSFHGK